MALLNITREAFPGEIVLFPRNGRFESSTFTSGEKVTTDTAGNVVMTFTAGANWTFASGAQQQQTTAFVQATDETPVTMAWRLTTSINNALDVGINITVTQAGSTMPDTAVMQVRYATMLENMFERVRTMFGRERS